MSRTMQGHWFRVGTESVLIEAIIRIMKESGQDHTGLCISSVHFASPYLEGCTCPREWAQSNEPEILPFRNILPKRVSSSSQGVEGEAGRVEMFVSLWAPRNRSDTARYPGVRTSHLLRS